MKTGIFKTKESDGDWIKVRYAGSTVACLGIGEGRRTEEDAMRRASEILEFCIQNNGPEQIMLSVPVEHSPETV